MKKNIETYTITAALPYANGPIHIGHLAGVYIPADIYARYKRLTNNDVAFICGSDEHGVAISLASKKASISPKELIDKYDEIIKSSFEKFGISFDNYSRTSRKIHHDTSIDLFNLLKEKNLFSLKESEQYYDTEENQFLADRYIIGTCPCGKFDEAYGDQCEKCGATLSPDELVNPRSAISDSKPILKQTKHYYIKLDEFEEFIREWITVENKEKWKTNVVGQVKSWLDSGLKPRAVTRDLDWGIPVKVDDENGKVLYVWFEAPIGYISSTKEWAENNNKDWKKYWKNSKTNLIHFIGKDNIVFHCIIFPIMLKMFGDYILPKNVPANEFLNLEGQKISTSRNWAVWLHEYLIEFPNMQDVLRYVLTSTCPETKDNDFTWKEFQTRNNSELVAIYGNYTNRVLSLIDKYYEGKIPTPENRNDKDYEILNEVISKKNDIESNLNQFKFREALKSLINIARIGNKFLADTEPWKIKNENPERVEQILKTSFEIVSYLAVLSEPFIPYTSKKLKKMIGINKSEWSDLDNLGDKIDFSFTITNKEMLFRRIEDSEIEFQINKLKNHL
ncbi:MAG: methionine--tRNA ligase [Flavobacteriales bacterium]|nr:MAG: methionine--tRNA ligase [Flavobacteriales bacterium]|tara:strand:- start:3564 stop:5252 length:1689 start_codon:yes stop_codon:yes gene_type:complete